MPALGETVKGSSFEKNYGGKGANQAVQCQRLGVATAFIGKVGSDSYGKDYIDHFIEEGIFTNFFQISEGSNTGIAAIWVDQGGNNYIIIIPGANLKNDSDKVHDSLASFPQLKITIFQNEINEEVTREGLLASKRLNIRSIYNPAPVSESCKDLIPFSDILCVNEVELAVLAGKTVDSEEAVLQACQYLLSFGCKEIVVTFGSKGAYLFSGDKLLSFSAPKVNAVDTVGAGDSFIGKKLYHVLPYYTFLYFCVVGCMAANLARGVLLSEAIARAVECASISVQSRGAQPSYARLESILEDHRPPNRN